MAYPVRGYEPKRYRPTFKQHLKSWFRSKWILRSAFETEMILRDEEIENLERTIADLQHRNAELHHKLKAKSDLVDKVRRQFFEVTERLHFVPLDGRDKAQQLSQLIKYILWRDEMDMAEYGRVLFPFPINHKLSESTRTINFMTLNNLKAAIWNSASDPAPVPTEEATFQAERFQVLFSKEKQHRILLPIKGPWDKIKLPYEEEEDLVRERLRSGVDS